MNQLHITLEENSPAIKWANTQADRIGARGHVGTHLDCYTTVPEKPEYNITAMVLDCQNDKSTFSITWQPLASQILSNSICLFPFSAIP